jgi:ABC-type branched-subunit amino acid transport system permease subunit
VAIDTIPSFKIGTMDVRIGTEWVMVIYAVLLILIMLFKTEGIMGMREAKLLIIEEKKK